jgi:hypothetical protein
MKKLIIISTALLLLASCSKETPPGVKSHPLSSSDSHVCTAHNFNGEIAFPDEIGTPMELTQKDGSIFNYEKYGEVNIIEGDIAITDEQLDEIVNIDQTSNAEGAGLSW